MWYGWQKIDQILTSVSNILIARQESGEKTILGSSNGWLWAALTFFLYLTNTNIMLTMCSEMLCKENSFNFLTTLWSTYYNLSQFYRQRHKETKRLSQDKSNSKVFSFNHCNLLPPSNKNFINVGGIHDHALYPYYKFFTFYNYHLPILRL